MPYDMFHMIWFEFTSNPVTNGDRSHHDGWVGLPGPCKYTQCTVKLRPNSEKIAQLKCTTNEKRNLSEHDEKNFKLKNFLWYIEKIL